MAAVGVALVLACLVGVLAAQTFQYSRGWTNGKKRAETQTTRDAACQLQKLRSILEGRASPQLYWPCDWQQPPPPSPLDYDSPPRHPPTMVQPPPLTMEMDMDHN